MGPTEAWRFAEQGEHPPGDRPQRLSLEQIGGAIPAPGNDHTFNAIALPGLSRPMSARAGLTLSA